MAFKRSAVRSRLSPPRQKALKTRCFQGFSFFASGTKQRAFLDCARISYTPCDINFGLNVCVFDLFLQNVNLVCACHSAAYILTQASSTPEKVQLMRAMPPLLSSTRSIRGDASFCCWLVRHERFVTPAASRKLFLLWQNKFGGCSNS